MSETPQTKAVAADLLDERLIRNEGFGAFVRAQLNRLRSGDLGNLPVIIGLIVICVGFYFATDDGIFLSSRNIVSITQFAAPTGVIALGIVLVLLLGEIDLSVGSVSGLAAAVMAVEIVHHGVAEWLAILIAMVVGIAIGLVYGVLYVWAGVPSFVFSLAGLLGFQGLLLYVLGKDGTINLPNDSWLRDFARTEWVSPAASYVLVGVITLVFLGSQLWTITTRKRAELSTPWLPMVAIKTVALAVGLGLLTWYVNEDRGYSYLWMFFVLLVVVMDFALRRTRWGRHVFAVGGHVEAARRSGIKVNGVFLSVFALTSLLAAVGGLLAAGLQTSVSQASGTTDTNLTAIAAAVIGGTSLFGGRGSAYSALLGILVLQAISNGLNLMSVDSSVRFMVTGAVLLLAVAIDSVSRRARGLAQGAACVATRVRDVREWLSDDDWARVQASLPIACVDLVPVVVDGVSGQVRNVGLIQRTFPDPVNGDRKVWCQIGGRVRVNESLRRCGQRHLEDTLEATALPRQPEIAQSPFMVNEYFSETGMGEGHDPRKHAIASCFLVTYDAAWSLSVSSGAEGAKGGVAEFRWFAPQELESVELWPGTARMLEEALAVSEFREDERAYSALAARQASLNELMWQTPVLAMTAMAFLLQIALQTGAPTWSRVVAAFLSGVVALISLQLMARHSRFARDDEDILFDIQRHLGMRPVYRGGPVPRDPVPALRVWRRRPWGTLVVWLESLGSRGIWLKALAFFGLISIGAGLMLLLIPGSRQ
ncbi:MAG: DUF4916 domain-containing protein [Nocardioides sp.]|uniref:DUF4916 domain-containing protein n=1 Tax=Nocardioides sp. TaxID=35761 RepID=UPI0039E555BA